MDLGRVRLLMELQLPGTNKAFSVSRHKLAAYRWSEHAGLCLYSESANRFPHVWHSQTLGFTLTKLFTADFTLEGLRTRVSPFLDAEAVGWANRCPHSVHTHGRSCAYFRDCVTAWTRFLNC